MRLQGESGDFADVDSDKKLTTRAIQETELQAAAKKGNAYSWYSGIRDIDVTDTMLFVKNTSSKVLVLDRAVIVGSNVICNWLIHLGSATTTPAGTAVTARNLNRAYSNVPDALAYYDETAVADGDEFMDVYTPITNTIVVDLDGVRLPTGHYIQFNQETESTSGSVTLIGYYE